MPDIEPAAEAFTLEQLTEYVKAQSETLKRQERQLQHQGQQLRQANDKIMHQQGQLDSTAAMATAGATAATSSSTAGSSERAAVAAVKALKEMQEAKMKIGNLQDKESYDLWWFNLMSQLKKKNLQEIVLVAVEKKTGEDGATIDRDALDPVQQEVLRNLDGDLPLSLKGDAATYVSGMRCDDCVEMLRRLRKWGGVVDEIDKDSVKTEFETKEFDGVGDMAQFCVRNRTKRSHSAHKIVPSWERRGHVPLRASAVPLAPFLSSHSGPHSRRSG